jgi:hypothetical protein
MGGPEGVARYRQEPAIPYHFMPCRWPTPGLPNDCLGVGHQQGKFIIQFHWTPMKYVPGYVYKLSLYGMGHNVMK